MHVHIMMSDNLAERLSAAMRRTNSNASVEPSLRTLTREEASHVSDIISETPQASVISDSEIEEMFSGMIDNTSDSVSSTDSDEPVADVSVASEDDEFFEDDGIFPWYEQPSTIASPPSADVSSQTLEPAIQLARSRVSETTDDIKSRFSGAIWYDEIAKKQVTIVGAGGIGSWTGLLVSRLGVNGIFVYDDDIVELGNMSGQFYSIEDVGRFKVDSLYRSIQKYSGYYNITAVNEKFVSGSPMSPIVIACLDSMSARALVFDEWRKAVYEAPEDKRKEYLFIDGRLSAETLQVFAVSGDDEENIRRYISTLFSDSEADAEICSYKQTSFMANMIASVITNVFVNHVASGLEGGAIREIPFMVEYLGEAMRFTTTY